MTPLPDVPFPTFADTPAWKRYDALHPHYAPKTNPLRDPVAWLAARAPIALPCLYDEAVPPDMRLTAIAARLSSLLSSGHIVADETTDRELYGWTTILADLAGDVRLMRVPGGRL